MHKRVSKRQWYALGGPRNGLCFRVQRGCGGWKYYVIID